MLLHDFLRRKAAILAKAKAEVDNLLTDITDPKMKETVNDWEPGDPITDEYPQAAQKSDTDVQQFWEKAHGGTDAGKEANSQTGDVLNFSGAMAETAATDGTETTGQNQVDRSQLNHQPEGQPQQHPAGGNAPE